MIVVKTGPGTKCRSNGSYWTNDGTNGNPSVVNPTGEPEIGVIDIIVDSPGAGYIDRPDGSLGGNETVWAEANEGYIIDDDGNYFVVPEGVTSRNWYIFSAKSNFR